MSINHSKKILLLSFILACTTSWIFKHELTSLLFHGMTFDGRSTKIKIFLALIYTVTFTLLLFYPTWYLIKPLFELENLISNKILLLNIKNTTLLLGSNKIVFIFIISSFFVLANYFLLRTNISGFPRNGQLQNNDLTQLIQIAGYGETENFSFGKYSNPSEMNLIISPDVINSLRLDLNILVYRFKPFKIIIIDHLYRTDLTQVEFEGLQKTSKFATWRQINGNLYYYYLPIETTETFIATKYGGHVVFLPKQLYDSECMGSH